MATRQPRRRRYPLPPGELRSPRLHEDEVFAVARRRYLGPGELRSPRRHEDEEVAAARFLYRRALEKYAPEVYERESRPPTMPHPEVAGITVTTGEIPPIGLVKVQDDQIESIRQYLLRWLKHLDRDVVQRGCLSPIEYEAPPDYYPDEQTENQHLRDVRAYMRRQEHRYLDQDYIVKGRATRDRRMVEAFVLSQVASPRWSESQIARKFKVRKQTVSN